MTPRYRTAFSVPSGFSASTPATTKSGVASTGTKPRKAAAAPRPQGQYGTKTAESKTSAAA